MHRLALAGAAVAVAGLVSGCATAAAEPIGAQRTATAGIAPVAVPSASTGDPSPVEAAPTLAFRYTSAHVALPNAALTPGAVFSDVAVKELCQMHYALGIRRPHFNDKLQVLTSYGIDLHDRDNYELDHLVPIGLGGSNATANLWPQPYAGPYGAHQKDALEVKLRTLVCSGKLALKTAQAAISGDWLAAYKKYGAASASVAGPSPVQHPGEAMNGKSCPRDGAVGYTYPKHVELFCKRSPSGGLAWGKRY